MKLSFKDMVKANYQQVLLVFLAFFAMVLVSYVYVSDLVTTQMREIGEEVMKTTQTQVTANLTETELIFTNAVQTVQSMTSTQKTNADILEYLTQMNSYFKDGRSSLPDFLKVYAFMNGEFLDGSGWTPPAEYYAPTRPWYIGAEKNGDTMFFSDPYVDADTGGICISFSQSIYDETGLFRGVVAIDLNLTRITDYVAERQISEAGYGILLSDTMSIITHRDAELMSRDMKDISPEYARLAELLRSGGKVSAERFTDHDGVDSIAYFGKIFNGWQIGILTPRASYYQQVYLMGVVLALLGFLLMIALSSLLISTRLEKLRADEESRSKSNFLARMSHEMRTPMNAIIGMTEIARKSDDPEKTRYSLEHIGDAADHLLGVINDVLDMSKIEAGKLELAVTDFSIVDMLEKVKTVNGGRFDERDQTFVIDISPSVPHAVRTDEQRLCQVLANLLSNAGKFTPEGGKIELVITCQNQNAIECTLQFEVRDNGIGLTQEQQSRLFRSFEQADNTISRKYGGTGLGLVISKRLVEMMGGEIWLESEPGAGSTFFFTIKTEIGKAGSRAKRTSDADDLSGIFEGKRVLLAEDVELNREILITLLEETGVTIDTAENGRIACDMFAATPDYYDLIFMDIHMPEMDGYEAVKTIRSMQCPESANIPIVAMTADVFREDVELAAAAGMNAHVGKPINVNEVIDAMRRFMR